MKLEKAIRRDSKISKRKNSSRKYQQKINEDDKKLVAEKVIDRKRRDKEARIEEILDSYSYDDSVDNDYE